MITEKQNNILNLFENEGLEVEYIQNYYTLTDVEGHLITFEFVGDYYIEILDNGLKEKTFSLDQEHLIMYSVLDSLDYDFEEVL